MKLFGTIDSFIESTDTSLKLGRLVANYEFLIALIRHGSFDQFHIFCPTLDNLNLLKERLEGAFDDTTLSRVFLSHHFNLLDALATNEYHAFHLGDWSWYLPKMAMLRQQAARRPLALTGTIHSLDGADIPSCVRALTNAPLSPADTVVCTSSAGKEVFQNLLDQHGRKDRTSPNLEVIPLGVPDSAFDLPGKASARNRLGLPDKSVLFLYVGRLSVATKADLAPLLYVFRQLVDEGLSRIRFIIAGGGSASDIKNIRTLIDELRLGPTVSVHANVSNSERAQLLAAADVFVSPVDNLQETFGISIVEAMAAGLPVVATDFDGYRDLVSHGDTGFLVPTRWQRPPELLLRLRPILEQGLASMALAQSFILDCQALSGYLRQLAQSAELRQRMGKNGQDKAREKFSWSSVIPQYEHLWARGHAQAQHVGTPTAPSDQVVDRVFEVFRHYPTTLISDDCLVTATPLAQAILAGRLPMPANYADTALLISGELITAAVTCLCGTQVSWQDLREQLSAHTGIAEDLVGYQLCWLLKYGLLELAPPA